MRSCSRHRGIVSRDERESPDPSATREGRDDEAPRKQAERSSRHDSAHTDWTRRTDPPSDMRTLAMIAAIAGGIWSLMPSVAAAPAMYSAVAVQYTPVGDYATPPWQSLSSNIDRLGPILDQAHKFGAMVAVVPEGALGMFTAEDVNTRDAMLPYCTQVGEVGSSPCEEMGPAGPGNSTLYQLWRASCLARESELTLVINLCETRACYANESSICPSDGRWQWNTELAFSPMGTLQMKYHKAHLFGGSGVFDQATPVPTTFETGGGFLFGSFICFDLMFAHPALDLVAAGIKDVVFSSWWVNAAPSFDAVMAQQAWSRVNKVNLIAANTGSNPANAGGGIYASGEPMNTFFNSTAADGVTEILFATLPPNSAETDESSDAETIDELQPADASPTLLTDLTYTPCLPNVVTFALANCTLFTAADLRARAAALAVPETSSLSIPVSQGNISCVVSLALSASATANDSEVFAVMALQGVEQFPYTPGALSLQVCALQHCVVPPGSLVPVCAGAFDAYQTRLDSFSMQMRGMDPAAASFPMLGIDDGQVTSTLLAEYQDFNPRGTGERVVQWSSSQRFQNQSLYAAVIYAVRPTATDSQKGEN